MYYGPVRITSNKDEVDLESYLHRGRVLLGLDNLQIRKEVQKDGVLVEVRQYPHEKQIKITFPDVEIEEGCTGCCNFSFINNLEETGSINASGAISLDKEDTITQAANITYESGSSCLTIKGPPAQYYGMENWFGYNRYISGTILDTQEQYVSGLYNGGLVLRDINWNSAKDTFISNANEVVAEYDIVQYTETSNGDTYTAPPEYNIWRPDANGGIVHKNPYFKDYTYTYTDTGPVTSIKKHHNLLVYPTTVFSASTGEFEETIEVANGNFSDATTSYYDKTTEDDGEPTPGGCLGSKETINASVQEVTEATLTREFTNISYTLNYTFTLSYDRVGTITRTPVEEVECIKRQVVGYPALDPVWAPTQEGSMRFAGGTCYDNRDGPYASRGDYNGTKSLQVPCPQDGNVTYEFVARTVTYGSFDLTDYQCCKGGPCWSNVEGGDINCCGPAYDTDPIWGEVGCCGYFGACFPVDCHIPVSNSGFVRVEYPIVESLISGRQGFCRADGECLESVIHCSSTSSTEGTYRYVMEYSGFIEVKLGDNVILSIPNQTTSISESTDRTEILAYQSEHGVSDIEAFFQVYKDRLVFSSDTVKHDIFYMDANDVLVSHNSNTNMIEVIHPKDSTSFAPTDYTPVTIPDIIRKYTTVVNPNIVNTRAASNQNGVILGLKDNVYSTNATIPEEVTEFTEVGVF